MIKEKNIAIIGIGAIGSFISCHIKNLNHINYYNRSVLKEIDVQTLNKHYKFPIQLEKDLSLHKNYDWIIVCVKEHQTDELIPSLKNLVNPNTKVAVIRNGLNLAYPFKDICEADQILECLIDCSIQAIGNKSFIQKSAAKIIASHSKLSKEFTELFDTTHLQITLIKNFNTASWKKLIESSAIGALTCLFGQTVRIFKDNNILEIYKNIVTESIDVAIMDGAEIEEDFLEYLIKKLNNYPDDKGSSMLTDKLLGRPIEINAKNGCISKKGKSLGLKTPYNDLMITLLKK